MGFAEIPTPTEQGKQDYLAYVGEILVREIDRDDGADELHQARCRLCLDARKQAASKGSSTRADQERKKAWRTLGEFVPRVLVGDELRKANGLLFERNPTKHRRPTKTEGPRPGEIVPTVTESGNRMWCRVR